MNLDEPDRTSTFYNRVKNTKKRDEPYSHTDPNDLKNMGDKIKRCKNVISGKMDDLWSVFISYSVLKGTEVLISPEDDDKRPIIPGGLISSIGMALRDAAKYHDQNFDHENQNDIQVIFYIFCFLVLIVLFSGNYTNRSNQYDTPNST